LKFVLDTNVILKALIKDSIVRGILLHSGHEFLVPEHAIDETRKYFDMVADESGLSKDEIASVFDVLVADMTVIPADKALLNWSEAEEVMAQVDKGDIPIVAASLSVSCDGIWSDDRHLRRQSKVRVMTTKDVSGLRSRA
jgi:predicted nucleic acid-binding protein